MKIQLEVEIEPEELRRLIGLPDMQPLWEAVYTRVKEGDSEMIQTFAKTAFTEGMKTLDMSTKVLKTLTNLVSSRETGDKKAAAKTSAETAAATAKASSTRRRSASSKDKT